MKNTALIKLLCALVIALLALNFAACLHNGADDVINIDAPEAFATAASSVTASPDGSASPAETAEPTLEPTYEPTPEPPFIPANAEEAAKAYEAYPLDYEPVSRAKAEPQFPIPKPRYAADDGVYRDPSASNDNEAILMFTGDLMCQTRQQEAGQTASGWEFNGSFDYVRDIFKTADFVVGNLEATLSESSPYMAEMIEVEGRPHLNAPACFLDAIRYAGFDMVVMSNNHNCDSGVRGIYDTLDRVDEYGLIHTGLFRNTEEPRVNVIDVEGIRISVLSYATYFNHKEEHLNQAGIDALLNAYSKEKAERDIAAAKNAGAEFVFVYIHWGVEYTNDPDETQYVWAQELADAGADYIIGSHPHALQPYGTVTSSDGRTVPVIYSMGNFVSHQTRVVSKDTLILRVVLRRDGEGRVVLGEQGYIPCRVFKAFLGKDYVVVPVVKPYNKGRRSGYFAPAYERITGIIGHDIDILGEL